MKKQLAAFLACFILITTSISAQTTDQKKANENLWLSESTHDFGKITQGKPFLLFLK